MVTYEQLLETRSAQALYVHIPFCVKRCRYCDFSTTASKRDAPLIEHYLAGLERLCRQAHKSGIFSLDASDTPHSGITVYIGGGTPTILGAAHLARLIYAARGDCSCRECTFEANPESLTDDLCRAAQSAGATRVSLGVQSFNDLELATLGRAHDAATACRALTFLCKTDLDVSCDLMCAIPEQTDNSWEASLRELTNHHIDHASIYPLSIEEGTAFSHAAEKGLIEVPDEDIAARRLQMAATILKDAGFTRYEVASYALPQKECKHNGAYWTGVPYLGIGTSAASMLTDKGYELFRQTCAPQLSPLSSDTKRVRMVCESSAQDIARAHTMADLTFATEELDARSVCAEDLMLGCRMTCGASSQVIAHARCVLDASALEDAFESVLTLGLATITPSNALAPTERGWLLGNELYRILWGLSECTMPSVMYS